MAKRGSIIVEAIIFLALSVMIIFAIPSIGQAYGKSDIYKKEIAAKEIALIIDTLYAYPYDTVINYDKDLTGFKVEISDSIVIIYSSSFGSFNLDPTYRKYEIISTGSNKIKAKLENPNKIKFEKSAENFVVKKDETTK